MKNLIFILALTGCSGESFTGFTPGDPVEADGGFDSKIAAGGQGEDDGGVLPTGTGGRGTGGSTSTGGATAVGTGGTVVATGGSTGTGGATGTGGVTVLTGGAPGTGGAADTGGATGTGGATTCTLVTHDNGVGQTWQDCVPLGTYNQAQALKACVTKTGDARRCNIAPGCGTAPWIMQGTDMAGTYNYIWGFSGNTAGYVNTNGGCPNPTPPQNAPWN